VRLAQQLAQAHDDGGARVGQVDGAQLGGGDVQFSGHGRARRRTQIDSGVFQAAAAPFGDLPAGGLQRVGARARDEAAATARGASISPGRASSTSTSPREITVVGQPLSSRPVVGRVAGVVVQQAA
jgi:hypothetical protein